MRPDAVSTHELELVTDLKDLDFFEDLKGHSYFFEGVRAWRRPKLEMASRLGREELARFYYFMLLQKRFEEAEERLFLQGLIPGSVFFGRGNEATAVGSAAALEDGDVLFPMHRNMAARFIRGQTPERTMAQFFGRMDGYTRGRDGNVHHGDLPNRILAPISHLGTSLPILAGALYALRYLREPAAGMVYLGEGAVSNGDFHEGINFAAVHRLPVVVVIENNQWAYKTPPSSHQASPCLAMKGPGYGIPGWLVDGTDVLEVFGVCREAVRRGRQGLGPALIECVTMRMVGHSLYDRYAEYVPPEQLERWAARDPIPTYEAFLIDQGICAPEELREMDERVLREIERAIEFAQKSPHPDPATAEDGVFAENPETGARRHRKDGA